MTPAWSRPDEALRLYAVAIIHHAADRRDESEATLQTMIAKYQLEAAHQVATVYAARGEADRAFAWLVEWAHNQRDGGPSEVKQGPLLRSLHTEPVGPRA